MLVGIIDYGMGNLQSVSNALDYIGAKSYIAHTPEELDKATHIILPGVGAFKDAIDLLKEKKYVSYLHKVKEEGRPLLGICLGMQLLFDSSTEYGNHEGLGLIPGEVVKFSLEGQGLKVPHMGWNGLVFKKKEPLFKGLDVGAQVYFVHSYHLKTDADVVSATTEYGYEVQVAAQEGRVFGTQFHPEKSGNVGLTILKNFVAL